MHLTFSYTLEDLRDLERHRGLLVRRSPAVRLIIAGQALMLLGALCLTLVTSLLWAAPAIVCAHLLASNGLAFRRYTTFSQPEVELSRQLPVDNQFSVEVTAESIVLSTPHSRLSVPWTSFARQVESAGAFVLVDHQGEQVLLPKRAFATPDDLARFRSLVAARFP